MDTFNLKNKATSNIKFEQIANSLGLDGTLCMRDGDFLNHAGSEGHLRLRNVRLAKDEFSSNSAIVSLHAKRGTHWVCFVEKYYFESYGCAPPKHILKNIKVRHGKSISVEYQFQENNKFCDRYSLYVF